MSEPHMAPAAIRCLSGPGPSADPAYMSTCRKGDRIYHQLKKLGSSLDWDRACFTMDTVSRNGEAHQSGAPTDESMCCALPQEVSLLVGNH